MFCNHCGEKNPAEAKFCFACGKPILAVIPPAARWRGASIDDISRAKNLSASDWAAVAQIFNEWRKTVTLTTSGRWLGHNEAWDNYFCGYRDGVAAGVNRALGISAEEEKDINDILTEVELSNFQRRR